MTIIAFGSLADCNYLVADRVSYVITDDDANPETFGLKRDKIFPLSNSNGYYTCSGDRLIFDYLFEHNNAFIIPSYDDENARIHFVNELNNYRNQHNVLPSTGRNSGVMICSREHVTIWRIAFHRINNSYATHDYRALRQGEQCVSWFGRLHNIVHHENDIIDVNNFVKYYAWQLRRMLQDTSNRHLIGTFDATDFILDEVDYAFIRTTGEQERGNYPLPQA